MSSVTNIPKKIHYCWFGRKPLPESAQKCIASWRKYLPDYEIIEWNEDNFDVNTIPYTAEAYEAKKYAFVSDYARFKILYDHGGLYFDTDVEVIKPLDGIVASGPFLGIETGPCKSNKYRRRGETWVAPGLGMAAVREMEFYSDIIDYYKTISFNIGPTQNLMTVGEHTTSLLLKSGFNPDSPEIQNVAGMKIYPPDYFNPYDAPTGKLRITRNTVTIHWYDMSWLEKQSKVRKIISHLYHRFLESCVMEYFVKK